MTFRHKKLLAGDSWRFISFGNCVIQFHPLKLSETDTDSFTCMPNLDAPWPDAKGYCLHVIRGVKIRHNKLRMGTGWANVLYSGRTSVSWIDHLIHYSILVCLTAVFTILYNYTVLFLLHCNFL